MLVWFTSISVYGLSSLPKNRPEGAFFIWTVDWATMIGLENLPDPEKLSPCRKIP